MYSKVIFFFILIVIFGFNVLLLCESDVWGIMEKGLCFMVKFMWVREIRRVKGSKMSMR